MITYEQGAVRPDLVVRDWVNESNVLIDCSGATGFSLKIGKRGQAAVLTKTTGIVGSAANPQITVQWAAGELDFTPEWYKIQITMTKDGVPRVFTEDLILKARVV